MAQKESNTIRIISGKFRSRRLSFPDAKGLRPTPDRVRETLFNWLQKDIHSAVCLDLFAGSGALGFEALSRGASRVVMVDAAPVVVKQLEENARLLDVKNIDIIANDVSVSWPAFQERFSVVFLDPPFQANLLERCFQKLPACLLPGALIYVEMDSEDGLPDLPEHWSVLKEKKAGAVSYYLLYASAE